MVNCRRQLLHVAEEGRHLQDLVVAQQPFPSRHRRPSDPMLDDVEVLVLRHAGVVGHELRRRWVLGELRFRGLRIAMALRALVAIEAHPLAKVGVVWLNGPVERRRMPIHGRVHGFAREALLQSRRSLIGSHVNEAVGCPDKAGARQHNKRDDNAEDEPHRNVPPAALNARKSPFALLPLTDELAIRLNRRPGWRRRRVGERRPDERSLLQGTVGGHRRVGRTTTPAPTDTRPSVWSKRFALRYCKSTRRSRSRVSRSVTPPPTPATNLVSSTAVMKSMPMLRALP